MNQGEVTSGERRNFLSKIKDNYSHTFAKLLLSSSLQNATPYKERDGDADDDTLIHNALVSYYDRKGESYPEWLGAKPRPNGTVRHHSMVETGSYDPRFKPVYASYNTPSTTNSGFVLQQGDSNNAPQRSYSLDQVNAAEKSYLPRSSSRLQQMYNTRKHSFQGYGYNTQIYSGEPSGGGATSATGSRLRDKVFNGGGSMNGSYTANTHTSSNGGPRATWNRQ